MPTPAIETTELTRRYGARVAVDALNLRVERGEIFGFLGPNGAGKTTTIAMLLNLVRPSHGQALVLGCDVQREPARALAHVGAMIEAPAFYPYLSGYDNLRVLCKAGGLPEPRIEQTLAAVELRKRAHDKVQVYSQGMRQRLALAAALLPDPELIILDEPTNGLDPAGTAEIRGLIRDLAAGGRTIFLCSHMLHEVEQLCERVAILKQGRLIAEGRVADLLHHHQGLRLRIEGDLAPAEALLRSLPWVQAVSQVHGQLMVDAPPERAAELNGHLARAGILVAELTIQAASLEDFFLEVTAEEERKNR
ncbi:ABC transporter ATP-binding protein [Candidatus Viridilinea mediisalina]|uniref:ABC transporter ATP-binding protein n=1 Tax=Candidatus Viridilinea mediisalina TaxID=2024553 RepID=A0A2A6RPC8_9CHLR|nr:ATP-binding cassette domain-containing protein [Candidatus Viridilinea mediisalina]PDW04728.1 ABC transporter ATP-binding protein [Candidatus Viridilinea mediisalina]